MSQRVNIQYSIEIDELPETVHALLQKSTKLLHKNITPVHTVYVGDVLTLNTLARIDELRLAMANVDHVLDDVVSIIKGYLHHKSTPDSPSQLVTSDDAAALQRQLSDFEISAIEDKVSEVTDQEQQ